MHHPAVIVLLLLLALLFGPAISQGLSAAGALAGAAFASMSVGNFLANIAAPSLVGAVLLLGVVVLAVMKLVLGV